MKYRSEAEKAIRSSSLTGVKAIREINRIAEKRHAEAVCEHYEEDRARNEELDRDRGYHPDNR